MSGTALVDGVLLAGRVLRPEPVPGPAWIDVAAGRIRATGTGPLPDDRPVIDLGPDSVVCPGLVDMHVHGGGGHRMTTDSTEEIGAACAFHLRSGTTANLVSLVTSSTDELERQLAAGAQLARKGRTVDGHVLGTHLEGPFLSPEHRGAHPRASLREPSAALADQLLAAADGHLRMVTLAPELPGAGSLQRRLVDAGITVAAGHTAASFETMSRAVDAGVRVGTHLFNGMRAMHHREPGPAGALLDRPEVVVELIADGVHVHPAVARLAARRTAAEGRLALVTDAVAATGAPDGEYRLGEARIVRRDGRVTTADGSSLGGSDVTLADAVRTAVQVLGLDLEDAVRAATSTPADAVGRGLDVGRIAPGRWADLVVLDGGLGVERVMLAGAWVDRGAS